MTIGKGFGLLFEMGCGKTLTAISVAGILYRQGLIRRVLVACPTSITAVWAKDIELCRVSLSGGSSAGRQEKAAGRAR